MALRIRISHRLLVRQMTQMDLAYEDPSGLCHRLWVSAISLFAPVSVVLQSVSPLRLPSPLRSVYRSLSVYQLELASVLALASVLSSALALASVLASASALVHLLVLASA